jgi:hypothetical protein
MEQPAGLSRKDAPKEANPAIQYWVTRIPSCVIRRPTSFCCWQDYIDGIRITGMKDSEFSDEK